MKKGIFIAILIGMFGFAIYSFVLPSDETAEPENEQTEEDVEASSEASIGLEQGNIAPDFELPLLDGGTAKLSDYRRSEEHTSELQSRGHLVCRLLLEK